MNLTLQDLAIKITELIEADSSNKDLPVMLVENVFKKEAIQPTIRHMTDDDIKIEPNMQLTGDFVYSEFDKGLVFGFITIIE